MGFFNKLVKFGTFGAIDIDAGVEAAQQAGQVQAAAKTEAIGGQRGQFGITEERLKPLGAEAAVPALQQQMALLGLLGPEEQKAAFAAIQETPGQRFIRERAQKSLLKGASAIGGLGGGNIRTALVEQGAGFAQQDLVNQFQRLQEIVSGGRGTEEQIGQFRGQTEANISNLISGRGQAQASGILGAQQAQVQGTQQFIDLASTVAGFA